MICIGVPELPPQRKREYLDKCDNLNFQEKKSNLKRYVIEKRHSKLDQSELRTMSKSKSILVSLDLYQEGKAEVRHSAILYSEILILDEERILISVSHSGLFLDWPCLCSFYIIFITSKISP
jgi:hypothetical protein